MTTDTAVVTSELQLIAAIRASAHPTYDAARKDPVTIRFGTCVYTFKEGIHERRAEEIVKNIKYGVCQ